MRRPPKWGGLLLLFFFEVGETSLNSDLHRPDTAGADARADTAADADVIVGDVLERTILFLDTPDRAFWASFETHGAIAASAAGETTQRLVLGVCDTEFTTVAWLEQFLGETALIDHFRLDDRLKFFASKVIINQKSRFLATADSMSEQTGLNSIADGENAFGFDHLVADINIHHAAIGQPLTWHV